jgi:hypothetical protein
MKKTFLNFAVLLLFLGLTTGAYSAELNYSNIHRGGIHTSRVNAIDIKGGILEGFSHSTGQLNSVRNFRKYSALQSNKNIINSITMKFNNGKNQTNPNKRKYNLF